VRSEFAEDIAPLHHAHHRLSPIAVTKPGKSLQPYDLFWLDDVTAAESQEALPSPAAPMASSTGRPNLMVGGNSESTMLGYDGFDGFRVATHAPTLSPATGNGWCASTSTCSAVA